MGLIDTIVIVISVIGSAVSVGIIVALRRSGTAPPQLTFSSLSEVVRVIQCLNGHVVVFDHKGAVHYASPYLRNTLGIEQTGRVPEAHPQRVTSETEGEQTLKNTDGEDDTVHWRRAQWKCDTSSESGVVLFGKIIDTPGRLSTPVPPGVDVEETLLEKNNALLRANHSLVQSRTQLQRLVEKLYDIKEKEGIRVARELHDELGQLLTGLKIEVVLLQRKIDKAAKTDDDRIEGTRAANAKKAEEALRLVDEAIARVQKLSKELRPPMLDRLGLVATFENVLADLGSQKALTYELHTDTPEMTLSTEILTYAYRIFKETVTSMAAQEPVKHLKVSINRKTEYICIAIEDDGNGTPVMLFQNDSVGVLGITQYARKHGGSVSIGVGQNRGAFVEVRLPCTG